MQFRSSGVQLVSTLEVLQRHRLLSHGGEVSRLHESTEIKRNLAIFAHGCSLLNMGDPLLKRGGLVRRNGGPGMPLLTAR